MKYSLPVYVMEMPLNKDGDGPEMDKEKVIRTVWEIWDMNQTVVCCCFNKDDAQEIKTMINNNA